MDLLPLLAPILQLLIDNQEAVVAIIGATIGAGTRELFARRSKRSHTKAEETKASLNATEEMYRVVQAMRLQIETMVVENGRLGATLTDTIENLTAARTELAGLSTKLDYFAAWVKKLPNSWVELCPQAKLGGTCPIVESIKEIDDVFGAK